MACSRNVVTVTINVSAVIDDPIAQDLILSIGQNVVTSTTLIASDVDGDVLNYTIISGPGSTTADVSGNARTGTLSNGAQWASGDSIEFDGVNPIIARKCHMDRGKSKKHFGLNTKCTLAPRSFSALDASYSMDFISGSEPHSGAPRCS